MPVGKTARWVLHVVIATAAWHAAHAQPANNACENAQVIPATGGVVMGDLSGATRDAIGTSCPASQTGVDVFYRLTPAQTGVYTFDTCSNTAFDSVISIHTDLCPVSGASEVPGGCNDDACSVQSRVSVLLQAGQNYIIRVGTFNAATVGGEFALQTVFTPQAPNDTCAVNLPPLALNSPIVASGLGVSTSFVISPTTACGPFAGSGGGLDVFYTFTPPLTQAYTLSTCGSAIDTVLSVHATCANADTQLVACNDDAGPTLCPSNRYNSTLTVALEGGRPYIVRVALYRTGTAGVGVLGGFVLNAVSASSAFGACCDSSDACTLVLAGACADRYLGDGSTCGNGACAPSLGACCDAAGQCALSDGLTCAGLYLGPATSCLVQTCPEVPGSCCLGSVCMMVVPSDCQPVASAGAQFQGPGSTCILSATTQICCFADFNKTGGVTIQDIFDFLNDWFAGSPMAQVGGSGQSSPAVQDIFSFLNLWFAGGC